VEASEFLVHDMVYGFFATTANLSTSGGGDVVSLHESNALTKFCDSVHVISARDVPEETRRNPFAWDFYVSLLISRRYDIAHFNGHPFYRTINALKYYNPDIKIVTSVPAHNLEHSIEEHHKLGIDYESLYPHMIGERFYEYASQEYMADAVVYPSKYSMDYLSKRLGLTNRQLIIPHGVDTPSKYPSYPTIPSVGYIGAWGVDKGITYLLDAMKHLPRSNLTLYGKQCENVRVSLPNVQTYGGYKNLDEIMSKISFGVFPSATEGFNLPALECMAYGRPIIISDGAGFAEYVTNGVNGLVVPRCNIPVLVESIKYLEDNPDVVARMGAKAYEFSKLLQWCDVEVEYIKLYTELFQ
jgi:glycosyltransferase involved in cell wall biosynthesis